MTGALHTAFVLPVAWLLLTTGMSVHSRGQSDLLPPAAGEWTRADTVGVYAGKDLFLLINGGADLFFEYGFLRALSSEYVHHDGMQAAAELYEMKTSSAGYGIFTSFTAGTGTTIPVGQEGVLGDGYCIFWKGPYVVMLTAAPGDSTAGQTLLELAGELERSISETGPLPALCGLLQERGLDSRTMVFVCGSLARGNHFPHVWANPFPPAEGVVGHTRGASYLILEYADTAMADAALQKAAERWEKLQITSTRDAEGRWRLEPRAEEAAIIEQCRQYVLCVSGNSERSEGLASILREMLGE